MRVLERIVDRCYTQPRYRHAVDAARQHACEGRADAYISDWTSYLATITPAGLAPVTPNPAQLSGVQGVVRAAQEDLLLHCCTRKTVSPIVHFVRHYRERTHDDVQIELLGAFTGMRIITLAPRGQAYFLYDPRADTPLVLEHGSAITTPEGTRTTASLSFLLTKGKLAEADVRALPQRRLYPADVTFSLLADGNRLVIERALRDRQLRMTYHYLGDVELQTVGATHGVYCANTGNTWRSQRERVGAWAWLRGFADQRNRS